VPDGAGAERIVDAADQAGGRVIVVDAIDDIAHRYLRRRDCVVGDDGAGVWCCPDGRTRDARAVRAERVPLKPAVSGWESQSLTGGCIGVSCSRRRQDGVLRRAQ